MNDAHHHHLRGLLISGYDALRQKLSRRLGSDSKARDALSDVFVRLNRGRIIVVASPHAYLFRMALNAAADDFRSRRRGLRTVDLDPALLDIADPGADPSRALAAKQEVVLLERAIGELTPRRRLILLESRVKGRPLAHTAERLGISQRMVEIELKHAVSHCAEKLGRPVIQRFGPRARTTSES